MSNTNILKATEKCWSKLTFGKPFNVFECVTLLRKKLLVVFECVYWFNRVIQSYLCIYCELVLENILGTYSLLRALDALKAEYLYENLPNLFILQINYQWTNRLLIALLNLYYSNGFHQTKLSFVSMIAWKKLKRIIAINIAE